MTTLPKTALALLFTLGLAACGGGGGDGDGGGGSGNVFPISGIDTATLETNLGIVSGEAATMRTVTTNGDTASGTFTVNTTTDSENNPATARADYNPNSTFNPVSIIVDQGSTDTLVMNGQVVRAQSSNRDVFYVPRSGSDVNLGMARHVNSYGGGVGIFGRQSTQGAVDARRVQGGTATYEGAAEFIVYDAPSSEQFEDVRPYAGTMEATVDFSNAGVTFNSNAMTATSGYTQNETLTVQGNGTLNGNGMNGTFTANGDVRGPLDGTANGTFYGPTAGNLGILFQGDNGGIVGGAILDER